MSSGLMPESMMRWPAVARITGMPKRSTASARRLSCPGVMTPSGMRGARERVFFMPPAYCAWPRRPRSAVKEERPRRTVSFKGCLAS